MTAEWLSAIATCIGALGVVFVALQARLTYRQVILARKQLEFSAQQHKLAADQLNITSEQQKITTQQLIADHERSRRNKAIEVLEKWTKTLDKAHPSARTLVESFNCEQCQKLKAKKGFKISIEKKSLLKDVLQELNEEDFPQNNEEHIFLEDNHAAHIYYLCITHLNSLEVALQSWHVGIADEGIIESQFRYLIKPERGHYILESMREVLGGKSCYPAIHEFVEHIKSLEGNNAPKRRKKIA